MKAIVTIAILYFSIMTLTSFAQESAEKLQPIVAEQGVESIEQAIQFLPVLIEAGKNSQWLLVGAILSLFLTFGVKKYVLPKVKIGNGVLPIVSSVLGVISGVGLAVINGADLSSASMAVLSGPLASTLWDSIVKYFVKK